MVALLSNPGTLQIPAETERRLFPRKQIDRQVEGMRLDHTLAARRQPRLMLALRDLSVGGCSALSDMPLSEGEHVSLAFAFDARRPAWDAYGRVIRCQPSSMGYRVAVEFDPLPAA